MYNSIMNYNYTVLVLLKRCIYVTFFYSAAVLKI